jgi:hypothetical protein
MPRSRAIVITITLLVLGIVVCLIWPKAQKPEPKYMGIELSGWLRKAATCSRAPAQVRLAILEIGTNAIPFYLQWVAYEPGPLRKAQDFAAAKANAWFGMNWHPIDKRQFVPGGLRSAL